MAEQIVPNISGIVNSVFTSFEPWIKNVIIFVGTISVLYLAYLVVSLIFSIKRAKTLKRMEEKLDKIYKKVVEKK